ncbi:MFS transporter, partial [Bacillus cereus]|nr:MFS transporter [Bacillus cereus]
IKGFIYSIVGVGFMLGAFVFKRLSDHFNPEKLLYFFAVCTAFAHLSLLFSYINWMALTSFGLFGFSVGCCFPIMST